MSVKCLKTFSFKLCASKRNRKLHRRIDAAGLAYNHCIALYKHYYKLFKKSPSVNQIKKHFTKLKKLPKFAYLNEIGSQALQDVVERIDRGRTLFFKLKKKGRKCSLPKFKKVFLYKSFTLKQAGYKLLEGNAILIGKQKYRYFKSREIEGKIKTVTVKRDRTGDLFIYLVCETEQNEVLARMGQSVGFDFGLKQFLTGSDGYDVKAPDFFKQNYRKLKKAHQALSRTLKESHHREQKRKALARLTRRCSNQLNNFHWKLAYQLVAEYAFIALEDLNIKAMQKLWGRKISSLGFSNFVRILKYCASKVGTEVVQVDRFYPSSQTCSECGLKSSITKDLRVREWTCPHCGAHHDRDRNAAINILSEALRVSGKA